MASNTNAEGINENRKCGLYKIKKKKGQIVELVRRVYNIRSARARVENYEGM